MSFAIVLFQVCKGKKTRLSFTLGMGAAAALSLLPFFFDDEIKYVYKGLIATAIILSAFLINFGIPLISFYCLIAAARTSSTMLNKSGESRP